MAAKSCSDCVASLCARCPAVAHAGVQVALSQRTEGGKPCSAAADAIATELRKQLAAAGVATIEQLGSMTPEQLEEIPGLSGEVESIQAAVNNYYGQFEQSGEAAPAEEATASAANDSDTISSSAANEEHAGEQGNSSRPTNQNGSPEE